MMLGYEWGNPSTMMLSGGVGGGEEEEERHHQQEEAGAILEPMQQTMMGPMVNQQYQYITNQFEMLVDERGYMQVVPKREEIGLNLGVGGRTYFSAVAMEDEVVMRRLYQNQRREMMMSSPRCQAEGCNADLSLAKHYHRRHKVCDFHSKASSVLTAGLTQRFCQQCSRFHLLSEFDNGKRSCRKRLADHNRRRRKSHLDTSTSKPPLRSSNDSAGTHPSSSPSLSPPAISLDCFRQTHFHPSASSSSSSSSNSIFFSSG